MLANMDKVCLSVRIFWSAVSAPVVISPNLPTTRVPDVTSVPIALAPSAPTLAAALLALSALATTKSNGPVSLSPAAALLFVSAVAAAVGLPRAKGLLMQRQGLTEQAAYEKLRKTAMDKGLKLVDVAQRMLDVMDLLG